MQKALSWLARLPEVLERGTHQKARKAIPVHPLWTKQPLARLQGALTPAQLWEAEQN